MPTTTINITQHFADRRVGVIERLINDQTVIVEFEIPNTPANCSCGGSLMSGNTEEMICSECFTGQGYKKVGTPVSINLLEVA